VTATEPDIPLSNLRSSWREPRCWRDALKPIPDLFDWYKRNVAAGTLFLGAFLVLKGYVLAKGDLTTALGILQYAGIANVVIAGLLSSLPILVAAMLAFAVYRVFGREQTTGPLVAVMFGSAVLCALFTPWTIMAISAAFGLLFGLGQRLSTDLTQWVQKPLTWLAILALACWTVIGLITILYTVWLPHEIVTFTPGAENYPPRQVTGYVLTEGDGWITILTTLKHQIVRYPDGAVKKFTVCERFSNGGYSDISYAPTLWREIHWPGLLSGTSTPSNTSCPYS
jgi:hypothetical protein